MNPLQSIIDSLADQADDLLVDAENRKEARTAIGDALASEYPKLNGVDRQKVIDGVMQILDQEDFFSSSGGADPSEDGDEREESE